MLTIHFTWIYNEDKGSTLREGWWIDRMKLHERIRAVRKAKGISQKFVAESAGMSITSYNMKELGNRTISAEEMERIAFALNEPIQSFFDDKFHEKWIVETA